MGCSPASPRVLVLPPAALRSLLLLPPGALTPFRVIAGLVSVFPVPSAPPCSSPSLLTHHFLSGILPHPFLSVVHSEQGKRGKERKQRKGGVSRGRGGGLRAWRSRVPERSVAGPGSLVERSSLAGSPASGDGKSSPGRRLQAGGTDPVPQPLGLQSVSIGQEARGLEERPGRPGV